MTAKRKAQIVHERHKPEPRAPYDAATVKNFDNRTLVEEYKDRVCLNNYSGTREDPGHYADEEVLEQELLRRLGANAPHGFQTQSMLGDPE